MRPIAGARCELLLVSAEALGTPRPESPGAAESTVEGELVVCDCLSATPGVLGQPVPRVSSTAQHRTGDVFKGRKGTDGEWAWTFARRLDTPLPLSSGAALAPTALERAVAAALGDGVGYVCAVGAGRPVRARDSRPRDTRALALSRDRRASASCRAWASAG
eukprot:3901435-Prymnesium_polylepis.1